MSSIAGTNNPFETSATISLHGEEHLPAGYVGLEFFRGLAIALVLALALWAFIGISAWVIF